MQGLRGWTVQACRMSVYLCTRAGCLSTCARVQDACLPVSALATIARPTEGTTSADMTPSAGEAQALRTPFQDAVSHMGHLVEVAAGR